MQSIPVFFMHPRYGSVFSVQVDPNLSAAELIQQLILSGFIPANEHGYRLFWQGQPIPEQQLFASLPQLQAGELLRVQDLSPMQVSQTEELIGALRLQLEGLGAELSELRKQLKNPVAAADSFNPILSAPYQTVQELANLLVNFNPEG